MSLHETIIEIPAHVIAHRVIARTSSISVWKTTNPTSTILSVSFNVTRFGKISPLWLDLPKFRHFDEHLFSIVQNFETNLAIFYAVGQICIVVNCQIFNK